MPAAGSILGGRPLEALLAGPGVEEVLELRSAAVGFMALHGGSQDRMSDVIAARAARLCGASLYAIVQPPDSRWHLPSHRHDPDQSPALTAFLAHVDVVVSVHGYGRDGLWMDSEHIHFPHRPVTEADTFQIGGGHRALGERLAASLSARLPGFPIRCFDQALRGARGVHPRNPVNLTRGGGVQLEVPPGPRGLRPGCPSAVPELAELLAELATVAARADRHRP